MEHTRFHAILITFFGGPTFNLPIKVGEDPEWAMFLPWRHVCMASYKLDSMSRPGWHLDLDFEFKFEFGFGFGWMDTWHIMSWSIQEPYFFHRLHICADVASHPILQWSEILVLTQITIWTHCSNNWKFWLWSQVFINNKIATQLN